MSFFPGALKTNCLSIQSLKQINVTQSMLTVDVYVSDHPKKKVINMYTNRKGLPVKNLCYLGVFMQV